jgi:SAM-dependent methyltransferase
MVSQELPSKSSTELGRKVSGFLSKLVHAFRFLLLLPGADIPDYFLAYVYFHRHPDLERKPGGWVYLGHFYPDYLHVGGASHAISREALKFCQGDGLDVGAGLWPLPGADPVDLARGPGIGKAVSDRTQEYVFSSHCLEHINNWEEHLAEWSRKLKPGGVLFLYLPHPECAIWHPGSPFVGDGHKWIPTPEAIKQAMVKLEFDIIRCDDGPDAMQSFFVCGRKRDDS